MKPLKFLKPLKPLKILKIFRFPFGGLCRFYRSLCLLWIVAKNEIYTLFYYKVFLVLFPVGLFLMGLSWILAYMSAGERQRILSHLGITAIYFCLLLFAIALGANRLFQEVESKRLSAFLVGPLSRTQFLLGHYLGLFTALFLKLIFLLGVLFLLLQQQPSPLHTTAQKAIQATAQKAIQATGGTEIAGTGAGAGAGMGFLKPLLVVGLGIYMEVIILFLFASWLSQRLSPWLAVFATVSLFFTGHWLKDLDFFVQRSGGVWMHGVKNFLVWTVPDLEKLNWRFALTYPHKLKVSSLFLPCVYALNWGLLFGFLSLWSFRKRRLL